MAKQSIIKRLGLNILPQTRQHTHLGQFHSSYNINRSQKNDAGERFMDSVRSKGSCYEWQLAFVGGLANICSADRILSETELFYLKDIVSDPWGMTQAQYDKCFNPEFHNSLDFGSDSFQRKVFTEPIVLCINSDPIHWKKHFVHYGIIAASHDGLHEDDLKRAYEIGLSIGLDFDILDDITLCIEEEAELLIRFDGIYGEYRLDVQK